MSAVAVKPWITTMSPAEFGFARQHGIRPIGMVSGMCRMHGARPWTITADKGWSLAIERLQHNAYAIGANAVVNVELQSNSTSKAKSLSDAVVQRASCAGNKINPRLGRYFTRYLSNSIDYTASGTAILVESLSPRASPLVTDVSMSEFVRLLQLNIVPTAISISQCHTWLKSGYRTPAVPGRSWGYRNQPLLYLNNVLVKTQDCIKKNFVTDVVGKGNIILVHRYEMTLTEFLYWSKSTETGFRLPDYLIRQIAIGTVIDTPITATHLPLIRTVIDMRDRHSPFLKANRPRNDGPVHEESGEI